MGISDRPAGKGNDGGGPEGAADLRGSKEGPAEFAGWEWDPTLLQELPSGIDHCGENGEFHLFTWAGPMFTEEIRVATGERIERDGFVYAELIQRRIQLPCKRGSVAVLTI
ncbi:MAG: hypothetical protein ABI072_06480 [Edaphobacter sp.]